MSGGKGNTEMQGNQLNQQQNSPAPKSHAQMLEMYKGPYPEHLDKKPVVTQELKDFAYQLPVILKQQAGINIYVPADAARLKSAYEVPDPDNPGKTKIIERDMLASFQFQRDPADGTGKFVSDKDISEPLETQESVAKEVDNCDFNYEESLKELEKETPNADKVHQFYMIMAAAKSGHLSVIRRDMKSEYTPRSVYLHENGETEVLDYKVGGKKNEMIPYAGAVLSDKLHLDEDAVNYNRLLNEERKQVKKSAYKDLKMGGDRRIFGLSIAIDEIRKGDVTREKYVETVMAIRGDTKENFWEAFQTGRDRLVESEQEDVPDYALPDYKPRRFTKSEQKQRAALSEKAARALYSGLYDIAYTQNLGMEGAVRGIFPKDPGNESRDICKLLLTFGTDQATVERNMAWLKQLSDSQDPKKKPEERMRLRSDLINRRMKEMLAVDYNQFADLDDAHFVEKWPEFQRAFESVFIMRETIGKEISKKGSQINLDDYEACRKLEDKFGGLYFQSAQRISLIANPYYATIDPDQILSMSPEEREAISSIPAERGAIKRFCDDLNAYSSMKNVAEAAAIKVDLEEKGLISSAAELQFNKVGFGTPEIPTSRLNREKGPYIVSVKGEPDKVFLYQQNPQTGKFTEASPEMYDKYAYSFSMVRRENWEKNNPVGKYYGRAMIVAPDEATNSDYVEAFSEILENPENDYAALVQTIKDRAHMQPRLNQQEFHKKLQGAGKMLSKEEVEKRRNLSHAAQDAMIDDLAAGAKAGDLLSRYDKKMKDPRAVRSFLLKNSLNEEDLKQNESVFERIFGDSSTPQSKKEAVEEVLKRHLAQKELLERTYTDEELVQNWHKINHTMTAMGMEYENFWREVVEREQIDISQKLVTESREMAQRVAVTSSYYQQRMKLIANRYFQYGQEEAVEANARAMLADDDIEWGALGRTGNSFYTSAESAEWTLTALDVGLSEKTLDYAVNMAGEQFQPWAQNKELTAALHSGQPMLLFGKDGGAPKACRQISGGVPPKTETIDYLKTYFDRSNTNPEQQMQAHKLYQLSYDMRQEHIEQSRLSPMEKKLKLNELEAHYKLDQVLYNPASPAYEQQLETALVELAANIMINKAALGKGYKEEFLQELGLDKTRTDMVSEMNKTDLGKHLRDALPKESYKISALNSEQLLEKITQATKALQADKVQAEEKHAVEIHAMEIKTVPDADSTQLSEARKLLSTAISPKLLGFQDSEIAVGTVDRGGVQLNLNQVKVLAAANLFKVEQPIDMVMSGNSSIPPKANRERAESYLSKPANADSVRDTLIKGMKNLSKQIFGKMDDLRDFSITELSKPENRNLLQATALLTEMRKMLEQYDKENPTKYSQERQEKKQLQLERETSISSVVGTILSGVPEGVVTGGNFDTYAKNYMASNLLSWSLQQMKQQSGGKSMAELLNTDTVKSVATTIQKEILEKNPAELGLDKVKKDPAKMQEMLRKMKNDQAAKEMGVKLTAGGKLSVQADNLFKPAKTAVKTEPEKKTIPGKGAPH